MVNGVYPVIGIGFILFNWQGKIFVVKELEEKPQYFKKAGMKSFPFETQKPKDKGDFGTLLRLVAEEMDPRFLGLISKVQQVPEIFCPIPDKPEVKIKYFFGFLKKEAPEDVKIKDPRIAFEGWLTAEELLAIDQKRIEVAPILGHFLENYGEK